MYKLFILAILYCSLALVIPNTLDLVKRKGGGGGGGGGGGRGGGSVSSSSTSSSGSSARTGSSSSGSTSNTGSSGSSSVGTVSRTSSNYRSGTYNGGAVSSYRGGVPYAGLGVPLLIGGSLGAAAWYYPLYNGYGYGYGYGRPPNTNYYVYNSSLGVPVTYTNTTTNGTESNPVICLCQDGNECGCGPVNSTVIEQTPQSLLLTAPLNGTTTLVINGTLASSSSTRLYPSVFLIALTLYSSF